MNTNARDLAADLAWLEGCVAARLVAPAGAEPAFPAPPDLAASQSPWARLLRANEASDADRLLLLLALAPHVRPQCLDALLERRGDAQRGRSELGGALVGAHGGFVPTAETALFLLAGGDLARRFAAQELFDPGHWLVAEGALALLPTQPGEPRFSALLTLGADWLDAFTLGSLREPSFGAEFPARRIATERSFADLVLPAHALAQLEEVRGWIEHRETLLRDWKLAGTIRPGCSVLFHGPPGTGKTLAACVLGKHASLDVYRVDLSLVVSKYIGETEKNLGRVFELAERRDWILFFDEADALFGVRSRVDHSHDRYANQEVSYLLQRIETFTGIAILASNLKANIDPAFLRRLEAVIEFPMPSPAERLRLWRATLSPMSELALDVDLERLATRFALSGGGIANVVRFASLAALARKENLLRAEDLEEGVRREFVKEGRIA